ncbi:MAG: CDP-alcohol phosphatidyltransferase family protein [Deltaproteobacteria bacterium]|jgi:cardiolipin synthase (CMP-forming)|nr:CDP-alcohol phosphatidyltransferase family protein [Deltaproteobacteria bacterium]
MRVNVANILTFSRLLLVPVFVYCFVVDMKMWAFIIFCVASFTDLIDGTVARVLGQHSKIGALLDPMADKALMQGCFIPLLIAGFLPWWFFVLALTRDLMIVGGIIYLENKKAELPYRAIWPSKLATLFQMTVAGFALLRWWLVMDPSMQSQLFFWQMSFMILSSVFIVMSGYQYVQMGLYLLRKGRVANA